MQNPLRYHEGYRDPSTTATLKKAAREHGEALHPADSRGHVIVARKTDAGGWRENSHPVEALPEVLPMLAGAPEAYISTQRFDYRRRLISQLCQLGALAVDLDFYKVPGLAGAHPLGVLEDASILLERAQIPAPSLAISSGRGLYLIWLHEPIPRGALSRWNACQHRLWQVLKPLGADRQALDAARVLRLAGTQHKEAARIVEALAPTSAEVWSFDDLANEILPLDRAELHDLRIQRAARDARKPHEREITVPQGYTQATLHEARLSDLQALRNLRFFGELPPGQRDVWMFLAGVSMSWLAVPQVLERELLALAKEVARWDTPEAGSRLHAIRKRAHMAARGETVEWQGLEIDPRYRFKNQTIIELLEITPEEERQMKTIISDDERRRRDRERKREERRAAGMSAREEYEAKAQRRRIQAAELRANGMKQREIAAVLGCTQQEVSRLLKPIDKGIQQCVRLYGGEAFPEGVRNDRAREELATRAARFRNGWPHRHGCECGECVTYESEEWNTHDLSCECDDCLYPTPRYAGVRGC